MEHLTAQANGAAFHVARIGAGPPLLLLHGWPEFWLTWEPVMTRLAGGFTLIAPDLRGFGDSDKPDGPAYGPDQHADDMLALLDVVEPIPALDTRAVHIMGFGFAITGIAMTFYSQLAMGASWRAGVDPAERTELVTSGPFAFVRNPIFAASLPASLGLTMLVPSWIALVGLFGLVVALELQVRAVEEPYLLRAHAEEYAAYAARVGRFVPGVGRIKQTVVM